MLDKTRQDWATRAGEIEIEGRAFVNGMYRDALSGETRATVSPGDGRHLADVANCGSILLQVHPRVRSQFFIRGRSTEHSPQLRGRPLNRVGPIAS